MWLIDLSTFAILTLAALPVGAAQASSLCDASAVQLEHSAPWVGGSLQLDLDGAAPGANVRLFHSPSGARLQTPFGLLELDRGQLGLVAGGQADASGHWTVDLAIPLDASLVEVEGHYQALVQDPVGPATLSAAVHLRYLGPRSYTLCSGAQAPPPSWDPSPRTLDVHAIAHGREIASIALGSWPGYCGSSVMEVWRPVFSANLARGAILDSCAGLIVFDNFACTVLATFDIESSASPRLLPSVDGRLAYVLEKPGSGAAARIRALDLASATFVATLELPATCGASWSMDESTSLAYVQDADSVTGELLARRVDLAGWQVLDALHLGTVSTLDWLEISSGWLYTGTRQNGSASGNNLAAMDLDVPGASASVVSFGPHHPKHPAVVPSASRLFVGVSNGIGPSPDEVFVAPLEQPERMAECPSPSFWPFDFGPSVVRDDHLWMLSRPGNSDYVSLLWNLDALALTWRQTADWWNHPWPTTLLAARGPLVDVLLMPRTGLQSAWANFEPALIVLDPNSGAVTDSWPLSWGAVAGWVLEPE